MIMMIWVTEKKSSKGRGRFRMLYPKKLSSKKSNLLLKILLGISILLAIILLIINRLTTPGIHWSALANAGIIYTWITVIYSINKRINIAGHVTVQAIAISILTTYVDYSLGFKGWSLEISIPIIIMIANVTMLILTIVSHRKYVRYAIYQLFICVYSLIPLYFMKENLINNYVLSYIAIGISILNFILTIILSARDVKDAIIRKFHI